MFWELFELFCLVTKRNGRLTASVFIRTVSTVFLSVAEQTPFYTCTVTTGEESVLTERFVGKQQRFHLTFFVLEFAVLYGVLPIAGLLVDVEVETCWTTNGLESLKRTETT